MKKGEKPEVCQNYTTPEWVWIAMTLTSEIE